MFDIGHGGGSFDYTVAEAAMAQGAAPDTISSDVHVFSGNTPGMPYLTWVMSKFLWMGFTLEQVVSMSDDRARQGDQPHAEARDIAGRRAGGCLHHGAVEGPVSFVDTRNNRRDGKAYLKPVQTVTGGVPFGRPYNSPFAVR